MPSQARDIRYVDIGSIGDAEKGHQGGVAALAFNRTGEQLASAGLDGKMCIWRVNDGRLLHIFVATSSVLSIAWVEENVVLCGTADGAITTISVQAHKLHARTFPRTHGFPVEHLAVCGAMLASGAQQQLAIWHKSTDGRWTHKLDLDAPPTNSNNQDRPALVTSVHWTRSSAYKQLLLVTYLHHGYILYDASKFTRPVLALSLQGLIAHASVSPDGRELAVSNMTSGFDIYETVTGRSLRSITHPVGKLFAVPVLFAHGGKSIIGGGALGSAHIWDATTGRMMQALALADDDRILALAAHCDEYQHYYMIATGVSNVRVGDAISLWFADGHPRHNSILHRAWCILVSGYVAYIKFTLCAIIGLSIGVVAIAFGFYLSEAPLERYMRY